VKSELLICVTVTVNSNSQQQLLLFLLATLLILNFVTKQLAKVFMPDKQIPLKTGEK
jgi:hypothetical protein